MLTSSSPPDTSGAGASQTDRKHTWTAGQEEPAELQDHQQEEFKDRSVS